MNTHCAKGNNRLFSDARFVVHYSQFQNGDFSDVFPPIVFYAMASLLRQFSHSRYTSRVYHYISLEFQLFRAISWSYIRNRHNPTSEGPKMCCSEEKMDCIGTSQNSRLLLEQSNLELTLFSNVTIVLVWKSMVESWYVFSTDGCPDGWIVLPGVTSTRALKCCISKPKTISIGLRVQW